MTVKTLDALVVGCGFGGIYMLRELRETLKLNVKAIDMNGDVGGTWYANRYPGAMSDTESYIYRYSWDKEDLQQQHWSHHYIQGPDVLAYLKHVVDRHGLRKDMQFDTELISADWDDSISQWQLQIKHNNITQHYVVRYLVTALGILSRPNYPDISGISSFKGHLIHTAAWPADIDLSNKRVGIIGNGSTGIQVITAIAPKVKQLLSFQRHPQYSVPSGDRPVSPEYREWVNSNYETIFEKVRKSITGMGVPESTTPFTSIPESERTQVFQQLWSQGNGFRFMFGGFSDVATDKQANEAACDFIRSKIDEIVTDKEKARKLKPWDYHARRPLCDGGYYKSFNLPHVDVVALKETPITRIVENGIETSIIDDPSKTTVHELDAIIFATGFDAIEGNYNRLRFRGRDGLTLRDKWATQGPTSYLGVSVPSFPNMFLVLGPQGPFCNIPPAIEAEVRLCRDLIARAEDIRGQEGKKGKGVVECTEEAEKSWLDECERAAEGSLFKETASWIFGCNVPGKTVALRFYFGGLGRYNEVVEDVVKEGYKGWVGLGGEGSQEKVNGRVEKTDGVVNGEKKEVEV